MKGKKVVITGGAGFIGSNLVEELSRENQVIVVDDLSTGRMENISHLLDDGRRRQTDDGGPSARRDQAAPTRSKVTFIQGSVTDPALLQKTFKGVNFVFHQAAMASVARSLEDPLSTHETNLTGTLNVLTAARDNGVAKVIVASSCALYGNEPTLPKKEDMPPIPESPYAVTKLAAEDYCRVFSQIYDLPTVCLRYFNVYGPRQDPHSDYAAVIPIFMTRSLNGQPLTIYGDGAQTRDFIYVQDVVRANVIAAASEWEGIYNIGSGEQVSINMLAVAIKNLTATEVPATYHEAKPGEVRHSRAETSKAVAAGFRPAYDLRAGLSKTLLWYGPDRRAGTSG